ncbi:hypothetical protein [Paenibacillus arenilitoris]|uniref:Uncharacterized protein n=1 Tax=Paenibacillus arenilitoris TaxID=2772299 RepID=A0A927CVU1_9BACL|nr:hypothetical protein [Paenibacillus arenilitoris]MBD2872756.1 hypothetical protein [Paenibacillus arenilitoris]
MELYFNDNFFSAGITDIMDEEGMKVGTVDLKSAFGSSLDIYDASGAKLYEGKFPFFSGKWRITGPDERLFGVLRVRMSFFSKRYEYDAGERGVYEITSPAFSKEYEIADDSGQPSASFARTSGWLQSGAFCLNNRSGRLDSYELVAVVMGVHAIQKAASNAAH